MPLPRLGTVEILLWLVPSLVVLVVAMTWVTWLGREGRGEVDPEVGVERMAKALSKPAPVLRGSGAAARPRDRSTGIAVRPTRRVS